MKKIVTRYIVIPIIAISLNTTAAFAVKEELNPLEICGYALPGVGAAIALCKEVGAIIPNNDKLRLCSSCTTIALVDQQTTKIKVDHGETVFICSMALDGKLYNILNGNNAYVPTESGTYGILGNQVVGFWTNLKGKHPKCK